MPERYIGRRTLRGSRDVRYEPEGIQILKAGFISDTSLGEFISAHATTFRRLPYVLISFIDSDSNVVDMPWVRAHLDSDPSWALSQRPLIVTGTHFIQAVEGNLQLAGFDEIWVPSRWLVTPPPLTANLLAPRNLSDSVPAEVSEWMEETESRLGLGDGEGLNYVVRDLDFGLALGLPVAGVGCISNPMGEEPRESWRPLALDRPRPLKDPASTPPG